MRKYLTLAIKLILPLFLLLLVPRVLYAQEQFKIDVGVEYRVGVTGTTTITHNITIENLYSEYYAKSYGLTLENIDPIAPYASENGKSLKLTKEKLGDTTSIKVDFDEPLVGKGSKRNFSISFNETKLVTKTGEVWEIAIPKLSDTNTFNAYDVVLYIPKTLGREAYLSPDPKSKTEEGTYVKYIFDKDAVSKVGISGGFGEFQVFGFDLKYHLENPLVKSAYTEIALPPDTYFQKVYYEKLEPQPDEVKRDEDGNWIATYYLAPRQRVDIEAHGSVQIFSEPRIEMAQSSEEYLNENLKPALHWETNDGQIIALAQKLKTPAAIYNYVVSHLSYDYSKIVPNVERLGALGALHTPKAAICMEFTDLFVAIARAAGIPAREINGFAYTENPEIEPLSLVADVLHAWPEYYDYVKKLWVPVDPTWGNTTGGVDFFNQLDLRHFVFVIHGKDSETPYPAGSYKLGSSPEKDVFVSFGDLPKVRNVAPEIITEVKNKIPFLPPSLKITVKNVGQTASYNQALKVFFDGKLNSDLAIPELLPFAKHSVSIDIPYSFLALKTPTVISASIGNSTIDVPTNRNQAIIANLIAIFSILFVIIILVLIHTKKLKLPPNAFKFRKNKIPEVRDQARS